jgi:S-DNA-T family DNA segregation ATPase FtsK/SpoIIIE
MPAVNLLISAAEHDTPKRARAYLMTDQAVASTAATCADSHPPLDSIAQQALVQDLYSGVAHPERDIPRSCLSAPVTVNDDQGTDDAPEAVLRAARHPAATGSSAGNVRGSFRSADLLRPVAPRQAPAPPADAGTS